MPLPRRLKKTALAVLIALCAASLPVAGMWVFQELYKKQLWDPRHAALVNGRPVLREKVEGMVKVGLYPPLAAESGEPGTITMRQILDKLVEEELVLQAAERAGLSVTEEEVEGYLEAQLEAWGCGGPRKGYPCRRPRGEELESLKAAFRERMLLEKVAAHATGRLGRRSATDWERYLADWSRAHSAAPVYEVRALLAEKTPEALKALGSATARAEGLAGLEAELKAAGVGAVLSEPIFLDPAKSPFAAAGLKEELAGASGDPLLLTGVMELEESYAVLEILSEVAAPTPEEVVRSARAGYEAKVAEEAFRAFVRDLQASAVIEINPNFPGAAPAGGAIPSAGSGGPFAGSGPRPEEGTGGAEAMPAAGFADWTEADGEEAGGADQGDAGGAGQGDAGGAGDNAADDSEAITVDHGE
ncbi:MAG: SurA N-terminal domain-containing protein [Deltaproteobacteria bacterium]|nr:SurA N-terminal domain-containing protein [Deltaproteobacteria bacterium]